MKIHRTTGRMAIAVVTIGSVLFAACSSEESARPASEGTPTAVETVVTDAPATTDTPSGTEAPPASPPPTQPPATDPPSTDPAPTDPPPTDPPPADPPTSDAGLPVFDEFDASNVSVCAAPDVSVPSIERQVTLRWKISSADSVYVAIDNVDGPFELDLPLDGELTIPVQCPDGNTFYVVAENAQGRTVMEATR